MFDNNTYFTILIHTLFHIPIVLVVLVVVVIGSYHVDAHPRKKARSCRKLGGRCVREGETCPEHLTLEMQSGDPYCQMGIRRCCYPVPAAEQCNEKSGFCVENSNRCTGTVEFLYNAKKDRCLCCSPGEKAIISTDEFISKYNKTYENEAEAKKRIAIYQDNVKEMEDHNKLYETGKSSYQMGVNEYSDLTYDEVISNLTGIISDVTGTNETNVTGEVRVAESYPYWYIPKDIGKEPESVDYRDTGAINPIRNQKKCGSCWSFSAIGSIESQIFLQHGQLVRLSEQNLIDCTKGQAFPNKPGRTGCSGGWTVKAMKYVSKHGVAYRDTYPYTAVAGEGKELCKKEAPKTTYKVTGVQFVNPGKDAELLNALVNIGPISVSIYTSQNMIKYKKGVLEDELCKAKKPINHAVVLVGYGNENGKNYWLIRNSWGKSWGEKGYIKLARNVYNHCRISSHGYIPRAEVSEMCSGGVTIGSQCLMFSQEARTWYEAKTACGYQNQTLASLDDPKAVLDYVVENYGNDLFFVGGSDAANEGTWEWLNGEPIPSNPTKFPWAVGQPDNWGGQNCLVVNFPGGYDDEACDEKRRYICEKVKGLA
ncbi:unnamed protein product, partial [Meganyctiphanes norvegica]